MQIETHRDAKEYWAKVRDFVLRREAENCMAIGTTQTIIDQPERYPTYHLFSIENGGNTVGAGWMTPPFPLGLSAVPSDAIVPLVEFARSIQPISGVFAPTATAIEFETAWLSATGCSVSTRMAQRLFCLSEIAYFPSVEGTFRVAREADRALLEEWHHGFIIDCKLAGDRRSAIEACDRGLEDASRYVWQMGSDVVSMVGFGGQTPSGIRISWVYTPPEHRGRGYASAVVAAMSHKLLGEGRKFCFLYTDLANPTSNAIYQRLGYQPVSDSMHITFTVSA
jgi:predicted GNAT family acetyltransferase